MASTKADKNRVGWTYTDDNGNDYCVSACAVYVQDVTDGAKYGGALAAASDAPLPRGFRMRKRKYKDASGNVLWIPMYTAAAAGYATPDTTLVRDLAGVDTTFTWTPEHLGEKANRAGCRQSS